ncbi:ABC transporter substrate-binding protein [Chromohalobacter sp. 48-RD10]|uniref:ABC transporter substrate-binding protein n=1 Tax=Chromohalobacter sp. 48-RD10 TaxID=2994063 RepID=UPI0024686529|nr:ABC transporter substrate-binding protein [Chromohalobacter sp. 48-RD10]
MRPFWKREGLRRSRLVTLLTLVLLVWSHTASAETPRIATVDWTIAETLLALGVTPVGVAQTDAYREWVGAPPLPDEVADIGLRAQPNRELLAQLSPDRILISPMFSTLKPSLERIAPTDTVALYTPGSDLWTRLKNATREIAAIANREAEADTLLAWLDAHLALLRQTLASQEVDDRPLLVVQFIDDRHVRVFGEHSLYNAVMARLGLENAWQDATNYWGFATVGLEALAKLDDARLVVIEPMPVGVDERLASSALWQHLPSVRRDDVLTLPPVWSFGGAPSAARFADHLSQALIDDAKPPTHEAPDA